MVILLDKLERQSTNGRIAEEEKCLMSLNRMALTGKELTGPLGSRNFWPTPSEQV